MRKPNFFIVGAPRCGTTSIYASLKQHPEVFLSILKEPHFFGSDLTIQPHTIRDEKLYLSLFADAGERKRVGEGSVWYLSSRRAAQEIKAFSPAAKIIIMLRNPVDMAYSLYSLYRRTGNEDLPSFAEALTAEPDRCRGRSIPASAYFPEGLLYTKVARYAEKVERYFRAFGRENVHVILFNDFIRDPASVYRSTLAFLEIEPTFAAEFNRDKATALIRSTAIGQLRRTAKAVRTRMSREGIRQHESPPRLPLPSAVRMQLQEALRADVEQLSALLDIDLTAWC